MADPSLRRTHHPRCQPGKMPDERRAACDKCAQGQFSATGSNCTTCEGGLAPKYSPGGAKLGAATCSVCNAMSYSAAGRACISCYANAHPSSDKAFCVCKRGFQRNRSIAPADYSRSSPCQDIDECATANGGCDTLMLPPSCTNKVHDGTSGHTCGVCPQGYGLSYNASTSVQSCVMPPIDKQSGEESAETHVTLSMTATVEPEVFTSGTRARVAFEASLIAELALSLGVDASEIQITSLQPGVRRQLGTNSTTSARAVKFEFVLKSKQARSIVSNLNKQLADPTSNIFSGNLTAGLAKNQRAVLKLKCPSGTHRPADKNTCRVCAAGTQPNAAQTACEECTSLRGVRHSPDGRKCVPCVPGYQPSADRIKCTSCDAGKHSGSGERCELCSDPTQEPSRDRSACVCPAGTCARRGGASGGRSAL